MVADVGIGEDDLVIEYKVVCCVCVHVCYVAAMTILDHRCDVLQGKITVKHAVLSDLSPGSKSLWKQKYVQRTCM